MAKLFLEKIKFYCELVEVNTMKYKDAHIRFDIDLYKELEMESKKYNEGITAVVNRIISEYFNKKRWSSSNPEVINVLTRLIEHENNNTHILKDALEVLVENNQLSKENQQKLDILIEDNNNILGYDDILDKLNDSENF